MRGFYHLSAVLVCLFATVFFGCITPPPKLDPQVIPKDELVLLSRLSTASRFASSGRADLAEEEVRLALNSGAQTPIIYNNLGFILSEQNRFSEAVLIFNKALEADPNYLPARINMAQALYRMGQTDASVEQYHSVILLNEQAPPPSRLTPGQLGSIYRNLSVANYTAGSLDDAVCHSARAVGFLPTVNEFGRHIRLLMKLERLNAARDLLRMVITGGHFPTIPPRMLADYSIAAYMLDNHQLAAQISERVLAEPRSTRDDRSAATLVQLLLAHDKDRPERIPFLSNQLLEHRTVRCNGETKLVTLNHWPLKFRKAAEEVTKGICDETIDA